jgi:hypothetical protein
MDTLAIPRGSSVLVLVWLKMGKDARTDRATAVDMMEDRYRINDLDLNDKEDTIPYIAKPLRRGGVERFAERRRPAA